MFKSFGLISLYSKPNMLVAVFCNGIVLGELVLYYHHRTNQAYTYHVNCLQFLLVLQIQALDIDL
jgi:hypothetical protein